VGKGNTVGLREASVFALDLGEEIFGAVDLALFRLAFLLSGMAFLMEGVLFWLFSKGLKPSNGVWAGNLGLRAYLKLGVVDFEIVLSFPVVGEWTDPYSYHRPFPCLLLCFLSDVPELVVKSSQNRDLCSPFLGLGWSIYLVMPVLSSSTLQNLLAAAYVSSKALHRQSKPPNH